MTVRSPAPSNVDPALYGDGDKTPRARSPTEAAPGKPVLFIDMIRVIENLRGLLKTRLSVVESEGEEEDVKHEDEHHEEDADARALYPVIKAVEDAS